MDDRRPDTIIKGKNRLIRQLFPFANNILAASGNMPDCRSRCIPELNRGHLSDFLQDFFNIKF